MSEVCTQIKRLMEGEPYLPGPGEYTITEEHTLADIARWLIEEGWDEEVVSLIEIIKG